MIANNQDQILQSAFADARQDLDDETLTASIIAKTRKSFYLFAGGAIAVAILLLTGTWLIFGLPLLEFAVLISQFMTVALFDLGEGWLALALMPINNIASLMVISAKAIHLGWKKLIGASFKN